MLKKLFSSFDRLETQRFSTVCYSQFAQGVFLIIIGSLLPFLRDAYGLNYRLSGLLMSCLSAGQVVGSIIATIIALRLGFKKTYFLFTASVFGGLILMMLSGNAVFLIVVFFAMGIGRSAVSTFNNNETNKLSGDNGVNLNMIHAMFALGALVAPLLVWLFTDILTNNAWRGANWSVVILGGISLLMILKTSFNDAPKEKHKMKNRTWDPGFLKDKGFWLCTLIVLMYMGVEAGVIGWLSTFFLESEVIEENYVQLLTSLLWAAFLFGRLGSAILSKYLSSEKLVLILSTTTLVFMIILLSSNNLVAMLIGAFGTGLGMSGIFASALAGATDVMKKYTFAMSTYMLIISVGAIVVPYLIGEIAERYNTRIGMWVLSGVTVIQVVLSVINLKYHAKNNNNKNDIISI